jgi:hypothetical protein
MAQVVAATKAGGKAEEASFRKTSGLHRKNPLAEWREYG